MVIVAKDKADAASKAGVSIARAFSFIKSDKSPREAFDWLVQVSGMLVSLQLSRDFCYLFGRGRFGCGDLINILSSSCIKAVRTLLKRVRCGMRSFRSIPEMTPRTFSAATRNTTKTARYCGLTVQASALLKRPPMCEEDWGGLQDATFHTRSK